MESKIEHAIKPNPGRFVLFPIKHQKLYDFYKKHISTFWVTDEIDLSSDKKDWEKLEPDEQDFILKILGFFSASDGIVMENLVNNFCSEVQIPEARHFYSVQNFMESIHSETYSLLINFYANDNQKHDLFNSIETHIGTKAKAEWAMKYMTPKHQDKFKDFSTRLIAFAAVEGIMFSSSFCAIFWLKKRGLCPGLCFSNELISRDEGLHRDFAIELYKSHCSPLSRQEVVEIIKSAVEVEKIFVNDILPYNLEAMNKILMGKYVEFVADHLISSLGYTKEFMTKNPFDWMDMISLEGKSNFFEKRVGEYALSDQQGDISFDDDF
jgi:ribonucleotide reductase beta subunit family protein with ferritin-like domain